MWQLRRNHQVGRAMQQRLLNWFHRTRSSQRSADTHWTDASCLPVQLWVSRAARPLLEGEQRNTKVKPFKKPPLSPHTRCISGLHFEKAYFLFTRRSKRSCSVHHERRTCEIVTDHSGCGKLSYVTHFKGWNNKSVSAWSVHLLIKQVSPFGRYGTIRI